MHQNYSEFPSTNLNGVFFALGTVYVFPDTRFLTGTDTTPAFSSPDRIRLLVKAKAPEAVKSETGMVEH